MTVTGLSKLVLIRHKLLCMLPRFSSVLEFLDQAQARVLAPGSHHLLCRQVEPGPWAAQHLPALLLPLHPLWSAQRPLPLPLAPLAHCSRLASLYKRVT